MECQKHLFDLEEGIHYLNGAYMSPNLNAVTLAGIKAVEKKARPYSITESAFFEPVEQVKALFAKLAECKSKQVAMIPSVSYGMQNALNNIPKNQGKEVIMVGNEFPSDHYSAKVWCKQHQKEIITIAEPTDPAHKRKKALYWTNKILHAITNDTAVVVMSSIHWMDGTLFDLKAIGERCKETDTYFVVDGTQSVGALPIAVEDWHIDALICGAYKWLLGPYSSGFAYYSERFNSGQPIEESWMNRANARDFSQLTNYTDAYAEGANRYNVGEFSNFIAIPMLSKALQQILDWGTENIQQYCMQLNRPLFTFFRENGLESADQDQQASHLLGVMLPEGINQQQLIHALKAEHIFISVREKSLRISPHVYNDKSDIDAFIAIFGDFLTHSNTIR